MAIRQISNLFKSFRKLKTARNALRSPVKQVPDYKTETTSFTSEKPSHRITLSAGEKKAFGTVGDGKRNKLRLETIEQRLAKLNLKPPSKLDVKKQLSLTEDLKKQYYKLQQTPTQKKPTLTPNAKIEEIYKKVSASYEKKMNEELMKAFDY